MNLRKSISILFFFVSSLLFLWFNCTDPAKPEFGTEVKLTNKQIQTQGNPVIDSLFLLYVSVEGTPPFLYHWYKNNVEIPNTIDSTLTFDTLIFSDTGNYKCIVENDYGSDTSNVYSLNVFTLPSITTPDKRIQTSSSVPELDSLLCMYITAAGSDTLRYQWNFNGVSKGVDKDTLLIPSFSAADTGIYQCIVTNDYGVDSSKTCTLSLSANRPPVVSDIPNQVIQKGATFAVINLDDYVADPDNTDDQITWTASTTTNITVTIGTDRKATITANSADWVGSETVKFTAQDPDSLSDTDSAVFTISEGNLPPVVSDIPDQTVKKGSPFTVVNLDEYVADPDNTDDQITWSTSATTNITVTISADRKATITANSADWLGSETVKFTAQDPDGLFDTSITIFTVTDNDPPVVSDIPDQTIAEGSSFTVINLDDYVTDADNTDDQITWTASATTNLTVTIDTNRQATIAVVDPEWNGSEAVTFTATDPTSLSNGDNATFEVTAVNDPPLVSDIPNQTIAEGGSFTAIELDEFVADVDNGDDEITWTASAATNITVTINASRQATIVVVDPEWNGSETVLFTAKDPSDLADTNYATFTVTGDDDPPVVSEIPNQTIAEGGNFTLINLDDYVADADNGDDEITWTSSATTNITVTINATNRQATITVVDPEWNGSEIVTFTATDPTSLSNSDNATFTVTAVYDPPAIDDIPNQTIAEGGSFTVINLDDYVSDADNTDDQITWTASPTTNLTVSIVARQATIAVIDTEWNESETVIFTAKDPTNLSNSNNATFTVTAVNDPPDIKSTASTSATEDVQYSYAPNAEDPETDNLTWSLTNEPAGMTINATSGAITWTPGEGVTTSGQVTLTVTDDGTPAESDSEIFTVTVIPVNDPPTITGQSPNPVIIDEDLEYSIQISSLVIDDDTPVNNLTLIIETGTNYSIISQPNNTIKPALNHYGALSVWVRVDDGQYQSPLFEMKFSVRAINDAPTIVISNYDQVINYGSASSITANFSDVDDNLQKLDYLIDGGVVFTTPITTQPSYTYDWNPTFGPHLCRAYDLTTIITDLDQATGTSDDPDPLQITVNGTLVSDRSSAQKILDDNNNPGNLDVYIEINNDRITRLDFGDADITTIPPEVDNITEAVYFNFSQNYNISELPPEIFTLTKIYYFSVTMNKITTIPSAIGNLVEIQTLRINENQITSIPAEIGQLTKIGTLAAGGNELTTLPDEITSLTPTTFCDFSNNKISRANLSQAVEDWLDTYDDDWHTSQDTLKTD